PPQLPPLPLHDALPISALKLIQRDADIECDHQMQDLDLGAYGKHKIDVRVPRSLQFSTMSQEVWRDVFKRFKDYCIRTYFPDWGDRKSTRLNSSHVKIS